MQETDLGVPCTFWKGGNGHQTSAGPIAKPGGKLDAHRKGTSSRRVVAGHKKVADLNLNKFEYSNSWIMAKRKEGTGTLKLKSWHLFMKRCN